ncbi:hypothetical protein [Pollutibacter soli]|uniref:hypothetical protein n=1 Tax=Pollutibacter soli TaxID=3034157 RepID=UPI00301339E2
MSSMEPEVRKFLQRIGWTLTAGFLWMFLNVIFGFQLGWAFWNDKPGIGNIIFYLWLIGSFVLLIWLLIRWWKPHLK